MRAWIGGVGSLVLLGACSDATRPRPTGFDPTVGVGMGPADDGADDDDGGSSTGSAETTAGVDEGAPLAADVALGRIEVNQGVAIVVAEATTGPVPLAERRNDLIAARPTLIEAEWIRTGGAPREIEARLEVVHADGSIDVLSDIKRVADLSDLSDATQCFNWVLEPGSVEPGIGLRITLLEADGIVRDGDASAAIFPAPAQLVELAVRPEPMAMQLALVPVATPDGAPPLTDEVVALVRDRMLAAYPLQAIEVVRGEPWQRDQRLSSLQESFDYLVTRRAQDGAPPTVYYQLVLDDTTCCELGGEYDAWAGMANIVAGEYADLPRDGLSKLYPEAGDLEWDIATIVHEVGHNHGRMHAPCGDPAGPDPGYPYPGAAITLRGFDVVQYTVVDPTTIVDGMTQPPTDFMSYCWPQWWSDYSWTEVATRVREVTSLAGKPAAAPRWRLRGYVRGDGRVSWSRLQIPGAPVVDRGHGHIVVRDPAGAERVLPMRRIAVGDADLEIVEIDLPPSQAIAELEIHRADGRVLHSRPTTIARPD